EAGQIRAGTPDVSLAPARSYTPDGSAPGRAPARWALSLAASDLSPATATDVRCAGGLDAGGSRAAARPDGVGRPALGRPVDTRTARAIYRSGAHRAAVPPADLSPGVRAALVHPVAYDAVDAAPAGALPGRSHDCAAGTRENLAGGGGRTYRQQDRWRAPVH